MTAPGGRSPEAGREVLAAARRHQRPRPAGSHLHREPPPPAVALVTTFGRGPAWEEWLGSGVWGQGPPPPHRGGGGQGRAAATSARCGDSGMARPERGDPGDGCPIPSPRQGGRQPGLD